MALTPEEEAELAELESQEQQKPSSGRVFLEQAGQSASFGYIPELTGAVTSGLKYLGEKGIGPEYLKNLPSYTESRDVTQAEIDERAAQRPGAAIAGSIAGGLATAPLMPGSLAKAPSMLGRVGQAAKSGSVYGVLYNPGSEIGEISPIQAGERLKGAAIGGITGAGSQVLSEGVTKGLSATARLKEKLSKSAEKSALGSIGFDLKAKKALEHQKRSGRIAETALDDAVVRPGYTFSDVADASQQKVQQYGSEIGDSLRQAQEANIARGSAAGKSIEESLNIFDPKKVAEKFTKEVVDPLRGAEGYRKLVEQLDEEAAALAAGKKRDLNAATVLKQSYDDVLDWSKESKAGKEALKKLRGIINSEIEGAVDEAGKSIKDKALKDRFVFAKKRYGDHLEISSAAKQKALRTEANRTPSLTDYMTGIGGSIVGGAIGSQTEDTAKGAAIGAAIGGLNRYARLYGNPILASGLRKASKSKVADILSKGAKYPSAAADFLNRPSAIGAASSAEANRRRNALGGNR